MSSAVKVLFGLLLIGLVVGGAFGMGCLNFYNSSVDMEASIRAQSEKNQAVYDAAWKSVMQTANVAEAHADKFKEVVVGAVQGRYEGKDNLLFMAITEANQGQALPTDLYLQVQRIIESGNADFKANQVELVSKVETYRKILTRFPGSVYAGFFGFPRLNLEDFRPITSDRTDKAFKDHKDEPVMPFENK